jgi:hypothetical protein
MSSIKFIEVKNDGQYNRRSTIYGKKREILAMITDGNLEIEGPQIEPDDEIIKIKLKEHQKRMIKEMMEKEDNKLRTTSSINLGVLADKVGSGKSMCILSLIAMRPIVKKFQGNDAKFSLPEHISHRMNGFQIGKYCMPLPCSLLVVPHSIIHQWIGYLSRFPTIKYYAIKMQKDIDQLNIDNIRNGHYNLIIIKSTKYNNLMYKLFSVQRYIYESVEKNYESKKSEHNKLLKIQQNLQHYYRKLSRNLSSIFYKHAEEFNSDYVEGLNAAVNDIKSFNIDKFKDEYKKNTIKNIVRIKRGFIFERVIFDEADSVNIPNCQPCYAKFVWCITSSIQNLIYPNGCRRGFCIDYHKNKDFHGFRNIGFLKRIFQQNFFVSFDILYMNYFQQLFLKNTDKFIEESFKLNDPIKHYYKCLTPRYLQILHDVALPNIVEALNAGNIKHAIEMTNCKKQSENDITQCILININSDIDQFTKEIQERTDKVTVLEGNIDSAGKKIKDVEQQIDDIDEILGDTESEERIILIGELEIERNNLAHYKTQKYGLNNTLKIHKTKLAELEHKRDLIKERVSNLEEKNCPVCLQCVTKPMITPCCKNAFCFECLMTAFSHNTNCPLCRTQIAFQDCYMVGKGDNVPETEHLLSKKEKLMELLKTRKDKRILLFSGFDQTFVELEKLFGENELKYAYLKGTSGHIRNVIKDYEDKKYNILILNAKYFGSGLNLQMTDDIIIYHRMNPDLEKQIIGRGQRLGRTTTLNVHYLCYETELSGSE